MGKFEKERKEILGLLSKIKEFIITASDDEFGMFDYDFQTMYEPGVQYDGAVDLFDSIYEYTEDAKK